MRSQIWIPDPRSIGVPRVASSVAVCDGGARAPSSFLQVKLFAGNFRSRAVTETTRDPRPSWFTTTTKGFTTKEQRSHCCSRKDLSRELQTRRGKMSSFDFETAEAPPKDYRASLEWNSRAWKKIGGGTYVQCGDATSARRI